MFVPGLKRSITGGDMTGGESKEQGTTSWKPSLKQSKSATSIYIPGNDSDKENRSPAPAGSRHHQAGLAAHKATSEVKGSRSSRHAAVQQRSSTLNDADADAEIAAFMKRGRKSSSVSGEEEMDCVQGLLSLSQGNWQ